MTISRRQVLATGTAGVGLAVAGVLPTLTESAAASAHAERGSSSGGRPFPPLQDDPNGILALPAGFSYSIVTREGETDMSFGHGKTPGAHDGAGVVAAGHNKLTIIQNHELAANATPFGVPHIAGTVYDPGAVNAGGCTVITTDGNGRRTPRARYRQQPQRHRRQARGDADPPRGRQHPPGRRLPHIGPTGSPIQGDLARGRRTGRRHHPDPPPVRRRKRDPGQEVRGRLE